MLKTCTATLTVLLLGVSSASAATVSGQYATYAVGAQTCSTVLEAYQADQEAVMLDVSSWLSGYISAHNRLVEGVYDVTPVLNHAPLALLTLRICENNRDQLYETVVNSALDVFAPLRVTEESRSVQTVRGNRSATLREPAIEVLQAALASAGFLDNKLVDGVFGEKTSNGIISWQKANNVSETGLFDPLTIFVLLQSKQ